MMTATIENIKNLNLIQLTKHDFGDLSSLGFPDFLKITPSVASGEKYHHFYEYNYRNDDYSHSVRKGKLSELSKLPAFLMIEYDRHNDNLSVVEKNDKLRNLALTADAPVLLGKVAELSYYSYCENFGRSNFAVEVEVNSIRTLMIMPFRIAEQVFGVEINDELEMVLSNGKKSNITGCLQFFKGINSWSRRRRDPVTNFDYTYTTLPDLANNIGCNKDNLSSFLKGVIKKKLHYPEDIKNTSGIAKNWMRLSSYAKEVLAEEPLAYVCYRTIADMSRSSVDGVKVSAVFNSLFDGVESKEQLLKTIKDNFSMDIYRPYCGEDSFIQEIKKLPIFKAKRKSVIKNQSNRAFTKIQEGSENLSLDKDKHKRTWDAIETGRLPLGVFFRKSEQYFLLNDNWDLWEEMFKRGYGDQACELASEVKGRTTYEKDLMSYFYFILHALPEFLKRHTGNKWTCSPKLVNSSSELEPPKEDDDGVSRTRSALTPLVDNEKRNVVVPYASLSIGGSYGTTYCYSHDYHVLTNGFSFGGYVVTKELEKCLNGRDDYGLMFYTLTGSPQGRGYPTFVIIFERRKNKGDVRVHFHRVHPLRSKEGDYNPIHQWIKTGFNWMMGNVNSKLLKAQQGDLFFISEESSNLDFSYKVNKYDNHVFDEAVHFAEYKKAAKSNILGYVKLDRPTWLRHNEHDDVLIPEGIFAIYQCRSWEANPKGVWSLRID